MVSSSSRLCEIQCRGAARGKPRPAGIGGVFCNVEGQILISFSKVFGIEDFNEAEILAILEALRRYLSPISTFKCACLEGFMTYQ